MASEIKVRTIQEVNKHPYADALDVASVDGWRCIVRKDQYKPGDSVLYVPPDTIVPNELAEAMGVKNYLRGKQKDRVGVAKIRGIFSEGLLLPPETSTDGMEHWQEPEGFNQGDASPPCPYMRDFLDLQNLKNHLDAFCPDDYVVVTEKLDGTQSRVCLWWEDDGDFGLACASKSLNRKPFVEKNEKSSVYWLPWGNHANALSTFFEDKACRSITFFGEIIGPRIGGDPKLDYGRKEYEYWMYAYYTPEEGYKGIYDDEAICLLTSGANVVPVIYQGMYGDFKPELEFNGLCSNVYNGHHKEGCVISLPSNYQHSFKLINPEYLEKKG